MSFTNPDGTSSDCVSNESEASSEQNGYQDWHSRFNLGLGELLPNWSVFSPFRRRPSKSQSAPQSPGKSCLPKECLPTEHIELVHFPNTKASESPWKKLAPPGDVFSSNIPVMIGSKPFDCKLEGKHVTSMPSTKEENICAVSLKKLAAFLWEEPSDGQGVGHDFVLSQSNNPTWCDKCGELLWGLYQAKYMRCQSSGERNFSKLKLIKTYTCSTVTQEPLSGLVAISIEHEFASNIDLTKLIDSFAKINARQIKLPV